jgi:hypothetical protein
MANTAKVSARLLAILLLLSCTYAQSQSLVYSVSYVETRASYRAHFANVAPFPGMRSEQENLAMLRNNRKTEIYSVSVADGKRALLFSDEGMNLEIKGSGTVYGSGRAYMQAVWRELRTKPSPGVYTEDAIYEIALDGSKQFRRVLDAQTNQVPALLNPQATEAAFNIFQNGKFVVSIYAVPRWTLLHTFDLAKLTGEHCPLCTPLSYGWLAGGNRLFFELGISGDYEPEEAKSSVPGVYLVSEDGTDLASISPSTGALELDGYSRPKWVERQFLGQLPDGSYLFQDYAVMRGKPASQLEPFLVVVKPDSKPSKILPLKFAISRVALSHSGDYIAYIEDRHTPDYRTEHHLWVKDLRSGQEKELFSAPSANSPASPEPNVNISVLGWINN